MSNKLTRQEKIKQRQDLIKRESQKNSAAAKQYKQKMMPLVRFLKKEGLEFKHARVGNNRIEFFRLDELSKVKEKSDKKIKQNEEISQLLRSLEQELMYFQRPEQIKKLKYPDVLEISSLGNAECKFASFRFDTTESKKLLTFGIIGGIIFLVLMPVWPLTLKIIVFYISLYTLIFLLGLIVLRFIIFTLCAIFGLNVWIFPNLFLDEGFFGSFKPFLYYQKWQSSLVNTLLRIGITCAVLALGVHIYLNPQSFTDNKQAVEGVIDDIEEWGEKYLRNERNFSERAIPNLADILKQDIEEESFNITNTTESVQAQKDLNDL